MIVKINGTSRSTPSSRAINVRSLVGRKPAATVYVTFEHEKDAQKALERLGSVSSQEASKNKSKN